MTDPLRRKSSPPVEMPQIVERPEVRSSPYRGSLPASRSYPVLTLIAMTCRVLAVLVVAMAGVGIIVGYRAGAAIEGNSPIVLIGAGMAVGLVAVLIALMLIMIAEMITLAMHIQANTLATAHAARRG